jgi:hypothetical protein
VLVLAALGIRLGVVPGDALLPLLVLGFGLSLLAIVLAGYALVDIWHSEAEGSGTAVLGIVYALPALVVLGLVVAAAAIYPRLTDISTDLDNPPAFVGANAPPAPDTDQSAVQADAYPDIAPRLYDLSVRDVYAAARKLMEDRGWSIVHDVSPPEEPELAPSDEPSEPAVPAPTVPGKKSKAPTPPPPPAPAPAPPQPSAPASAELQAVAPTLVFRFEDDVVVRIEATDDGTEVDMRSVSRVGAHDLGENARRIRSFFTDLDAALQPGLDAAGAGPAPPPPVQSGEPAGQ